MVMFRVVWCGVVKVREREGMREKKKKKKGGGLGVRCWEEISWGFSLLLWMCTWLFSTYLKVLGNLFPVWVGMGKTVVGRRAQCNIYFSYKTNRPLAYFLFSVVIVTLLNVIGDASAPICSRSCSTDGSVQLDQYSGSGRVTFVHGT